MTWGFFVPNEKIDLTGQQNSGPFGWGWYYTYGPDLCHNTESWADAGFDNSGQSTTSPWNTDITAPTTCP